MSQSVEVFRGQLSRERSRQLMLESEVQQPAYFKRELRNIQKSNLELQSLVDGKSPERREGDAETFRRARQ